MWQVLLAVTVWSVGNLTLGFLMGKYHERINWNKLIKKGIIPAPKSR